VVKTLIGPVETEKDEMSKYYIKNSQHELDGLLVDCANAVDMHLAMNKVHWYHRFFSDHPSNRPQYVGDLNAHPGDSKHCHNIDPLKFNADHSLNCRNQLSFDHLMAHPDKAEVLVPFSQSVKPLNSDRSTEQNLIAITYALFEIARVCPFLQPLSLDAILNGCRLDKAYGK
jgi:hypothetical protein